MQEFTLILDRLEIPRNRVMAMIGNNTDDVSFVVDHTYQTKENDLTHPGGKK
jgi:hypothetical protein